MNFIEKLPLSSRFDTILVIVNQFTKQVIFIPVHDTMTSVCPLYIFQTQYSFSYYLWQRLGVCVKLLPIFRHCSQHCGFTSLQTTTPKVMNKLNAWIRLSSNTFVYIVTTSKTTGPNSYLSWSLPTIMLQVLLLVFPHYLLIRDIIQTSLFTLNAILFPSKPTTLP